MLTECFRISGGNRSRLSLAMNYIQVHTGLDYVQTLSNFLEADGWNILSVEEKALIMKEFDRVKEAHDMERDRFHENPAERLAGVLGELLPSPYYDRSYKGSWGSLVEEFELISGTTLESLDRREFIDYLNVIHDTWKPNKNK